MTTDKELIERLRKAEKTWSTHGLQTGDFDAAADALEAAKQRIANLKAALSNNMNYNSAYYTRAVRAEKENKRLDAALARIEKHRDAGGMAYVLGEIARKTRTRK